MKRTALQVNLDERLAEAVYRLAKQDGASVSAVLRESVEQYVANRADDADPFSDLIGMFDDGEPFDARDLDEELAKDHEERFG
jgi:predicted transcriptional regulator